MQQNDFPCMLYKAPGPHDIHGGQFDYCIVQNDEEQAQALVDGWALTTVDALAALVSAKAPPQEEKVPAPTTAPATPHPPAPPAELDRDVLKAEADALGIEYAKNIPTDKLAALVAEKKQG